RLPQDRAQLQPADGDRGPDLRRRGRGDRARGKPRPGLHPFAEHLREADDPRRSLRQEDRVPHDPAKGSGMIRPFAFAIGLAAAGAAAAQTPEPRVPPGMQWLYGSGEGAASTVQAYRAFRTYVL